jgi:hypothetical protein
MDACLKDRAAGNPRHLIDTVAKVTYGSQDRALVKLPLSPLLNN